jgi:hypothetical protein
MQWGKEAGTVMILLCCILFSGCSVEPLYDKRNDSNDLLQVRDSCIEVDIIAERDGQKLRNFLMDSLRDLNLTEKKYRLIIRLSDEEKAFAFATDGNAKRLRLSYIANVALVNQIGKEVFSQSVTVSSNSNIANAHGEVLLSLYRRNSTPLLKELSARIVESVRIALLSLES